MPVPYDIALIAGRREELLARTLASFADRVFPNFTIGKVIVNIDPFMNDVAEGDRCEALVRQWFPEATVFRPRKADFASAVKRVWAATTAPRVLHLEDDWLALEPITPDRVEALLEAGVGSVTFTHSNKHTRGRPDQLARRTYTTEDGTVREVLENCHSTSPGVFVGDFLRQAAAVMRPKMDPERQFSRALNPELEALAFPLRCVFMNGQSSRFLIEDIGRTYREARGIVRSKNRFRAIWVQVPPTSDGAV